MVVVSRRHALTHACRQAGSQARPHTARRARTNAHKPKRNWAHTRTHMHTRMQPRAHEHTHAHTHAAARSRTHTCRHARTTTQKVTVSNFSTTEAVLMLDCLLFLFQHHACTHPSRHAQTHAHLQMPTHTCKHACTPAHPHPCPHKQAHARSQASGGTQAPGAGAGSGARQDEVHQGRLVLQGHQLRQDLRVRVQRLWACVVGGTSGRARLLAARERL